MAVTAASMLTCKHDTQNILLRQHMWSRLLLKQRWRVRWNLIIRRGKCVSDSSAGRSLSPSLLCFRCSAQQRIHPATVVFGRTVKQAGGNDCAFSSYHQCKENSRACIANPWIEPLPTVPGSTVFMLAHHHSSLHRPSLKLVSSPLLAQQRGDGACVNAVERPVSADYCWRHRREILPWHSGPVAVPVVTTGATAGLPVRPRRPPWCGGYPTERLPSIPAQARPAVWSKTPRITQRCCPYVALKRSFNGD